MIKAEFEYHLKEVRAGVWAINRTSGQIRRMAIVYFCVFAFVLACALLPHLHGQVRTPGTSSTYSAPSRTDPWFVSALPATIVLVGLSGIIFFRLRRGNVGKQHPLLGHLWTLEIDSELVKMGDFTQRSELRWAAFCKFAENRDFFLLFNDRLRAIIVPKRVLDATSIAELRRLGQEHIHPKTGGFPVIPFAQKAAESDAPQNT